MPDNNVNILWQRCSDIIRDNVTATVFNTWFAPLEVVGLRDNTLVLRVKSQFVAEYIEENYIDLLSKAIVRVFGKGTCLEYRVLMDSTTGTATTYPSDARGDDSYIPEQSRNFTNGNWDTQLNQVYTFANFVAGESNKLARAAGVAISKDPGKTIFNPLFIYGGSGVGKTHLANAIGNQIAQYMRSKKVLYVSANTFKLQFQDAVASNHVPNFLQFYQGVDVLILDDIQFFAGLKATQDTFFHIFNYLHQSGKQLILTSDRSPLELKDVEERLLTRFKWGLSVEIKRPDLQLRKAILRDKIAKDGLELSDEIVDYIALHACENVRDMEGVLASLVAYSMLMECDVDLALVESVINRLVSVQPRVIEFADVLGAVCEHENVTEKAVRSQSRQREVIRARQMIVYLSKELTDKSMAEIGKMLGNRSHATISHALSTIKDQMEYDKVLRHDVELINSELVR